MPPRLMVDRRPPLPPPRRPVATPASVPAAGSAVTAARASPPPPSANAATASIEVVIERLRVDEGRKASCEVDGRRVPRMGTRLCSDAKSAAAAAGVLTDDGTRDADAAAAAAGDGDRLSPPCQLRHVTPAQCSSSSVQLDDADMTRAGDRQESVSCSTQTESLASSSSDATAVRVCADVMYTNRANLRHTIAVQQRLFRQQLADRKLTAPPPPSVSECPAVVSRHSAAAADSKPACHADKLEWVVRKRSDGSRYVTRRPVRPARHARCSTWVVDTTTDDDEREQPKTGRYWTRDERRQHVAERRQREAMKTRSGCLAASGQRAQHPLTAELAAISRHRQTTLLSVATV